MNEQIELSQSEPTGNTKTVGATNQLYKWFFTLKEESIELSQLFQTLKEISKKFTFQLEQGESGFRHFQGVFSLKIKERFSTVKNIFPCSIHLEPCKNWWQSMKYCSKSETRINGPWTEKSIFINTIKEEDFYPWQANAAQILKTTPNDRNVFWFWDAVGNKGKTAFCKWAYVNHGATILQNGSGKDLAFAIPETPTAVLFNLPRTCEERVNYAAIESIKDGLIFSAKYESGTKVFDPPHVIIFANFPPDLRSLSADRWQIMNIN